MFEALLKTQSMWSEGGSAAGAGDGSTSAGGGTGGAAGGAGSGSLGPSGLGMMTKSASMSDARSSFDSRQNSMSRGGGGAGGGDRRLALSRPEMALGLLVEVAYEHDEEFRAHLPQVGRGGEGVRLCVPVRRCRRPPASHGQLRLVPHPSRRPPALPQLLHVCLLAADSANPIVRRDAQQLLVYLLYSLSLKHLEGAQVGRPRGAGCGGLGLQGCCARDAGLGARKGWHSTPVLPCHMLAPLAATCMRKLLSSLPANPCA